MKENWKIKKEPLFNKFVNIIGPQGVGKTSCGATVFVLDFKYCSKIRTKLANDFIEEINVNRERKIPKIRTHLYFSNVKILLDKKRGIYTHSVNLSDLSIPDKEKLNYFPKGSIFFIQEADSEADSRDWRNLARGLIEFAKRYRHMNYTVIVDMQVNENMDKKLRQLFTNIWFMYYSGTKRKWFFCKQQKWYFYDLQNQLNEFAKTLASIGVNVKLDVVRKRVLEFKPEIFKRYNSFSSDVYFLDGLVEYIFKEFPEMTYSEKAVSEYVKQHPIIN